MNQPNVNFFPWDDTDDKNAFATTLPSGMFHMSMQLEDGMSSTGKRMFKGVFTAKLPAECAGMSHFEYFVVGTDENPNGINSDVRGAKALKACLAAAMVPPSNDIAQLVMSANGAELMMQLQQYEEKSGDYKGTMRNKIVKVFRLGEAQAAVAGAPGIGAGGGGNVPKQAPPSPAQMNVPPVQLQMQQAPPVQQPLPQPAPQPTAAPVQQAQTAQPMQQVQPAAQPAPVTAQPAQPTYVPPTQPVQQVQQAPAPQQQMPVPGQQIPMQSTDPMVRCTICQYDVPSSKFTEHIQWHAANPGAQWQPGM
jgi:hypothetical protein